MTSGIYKITNKKNGKVYIGLSNNIEKRFMDHKGRAKLETSKEYNKTLYRAIRKYGEENFTLDILFESEDREVLSQKEIEYISNFNSYSSGYNETPGGDGVKINNGEKHPNSKLKETDVEFIRTMYKNKARKRDVYEHYFQEKIGFSGFSKIWKGESWSYIMPEVYTEELRYFHSQNTANKGSKNGRAKLKEEDVRNIRLRRKNGEILSDVYNDYSHLLTKGSFANVWSYQNWKNIIV